jgi:hypothetical protein
MRLQLVGGHRAHSPQPAHRQRAKERQLPIGRHQQQPVGLGFPAGDLGKKFGPRDPDRNGQSGAVADVGAQPLPDPQWGAGNPGEAADIEEGLIHRHGLHDRCDIAEHLEDRVTGAGVGGHPGWHDDGVRAQQPRLSSAHGGAHAVGLGLIAGRQHHSAAHDHRAATQARVVALFYRRVERIEIRVQDGRVTPHERMFARGYDS